MPDVDTLMRYENGQTTDEETLNFFADLIKSGTVWHLQGSYGRAARCLIETGLITSEGEITDAGRAWVEL